MSEILHKTTKKIIEDPIFLKIIETKLNSIMVDGKIDKNDIPDIILLIVYCTNNLKKFNLSYKQLTEVLEETILYILNHFDVIPDDKRDELMEMIQTMIKLVMLQPKVKSCLMSLFSKLKCWK
jgi:hypothetical protein